MEIWKDIIEFEGKYKVSNLGNIKSYIKDINGILMKQKIDKDGYKSIALSLGNGKYKYLRVHRLVAETFLDNPYQYPIVNHINGIKDDNKLENLEWCDNSMNQSHRFNVLKKGYEHSKYEHNFVKVKATKDGVLIKEFLSVNECARYFDVSDSCIWNKLMGRTNNPSHHKQKTRDIYFEIILN